MLLMRKIKDWKAHQKKRKYDRTKSAEMRSKINESSSRICMATVKERQKRYKEMLCYREMKIVYGENGMARILKESKSREYWKKKKNRSLKGRKKSCKKKSGCPHQMCKYCSSVSDLCCEWGSICDATSSARHETSLA